jgi:hypothetical protein
LLEVVSNTWTRSSQRASALADANSVVINAPPKRGQQRITHQFGAMFASILLREWFDERDTAAEAAKL